MLIFFGWSMWLVWYMEQRSKAADRNTTTVKDYSVGLLAHCGPSLRIPGPPHMES
jgi:hypothetical protein